jgi:PAS domain S-box-containing protein
MVAPAKRTRTPLRVLLVEDSEEDAMLLLRELRRGGYEPEHERVETFEAMQRALAGSEWDVILSDHRLPRFGSSEALELTRGAHSQAPFIIVSGRIGEEAALEAVKAGAYDYVMKDNLARLYPSVERSLKEAEQRRRAERELERRDAILEAVRFAADRLLGEAVGWEQSIRAVVRRLGEATGVSHVYVYENSVGEDGEIRGNIRYEWAAPGIPVHTDDPAAQAFPYHSAGFERYAEMLGRGEPVYGRTWEFTEQEQLGLRVRGILALAIVPIFVEGQWWGFIGFDECSEEREWSMAEVGALGAAAGTLGAAIKRRRVEERLRSSEAELRAVFGAMNDVILVLDGEGYYLKVAPTNPSLPYRPTAELIGKTLHDTFPDEQADVFLDGIRRALETRQRIEIEYSLLIGDQERWFATTISPMLEDSVVAVARDITERKKNEEALRESEERFKALAEATFEGVAITQDGKIVETNAVFAEMFGYEHSEVIGMTPLDLAAPEFREALRNIRALGLEEPYEAVASKKDGTTFDIEVREKWSHYKGHPVRVAALRDITERKKNEAALRESEERFRSAFDSAAIGMGLLGLDGRWLRVNRPLCEIVGYSERELLDLTFQDVTHPDDLDRDLQQVGRLLQGETRAYQLEKRYLHKDGHVVWIRLSASLVRDGEGAPLYFISQIEDITRRKQAEEALRQSEHRLRTIVDTEPECVKVLDMDGSLLEINPAGLAMFEADSLEQVRGRPVYDIVVPEYRADFVALTEKVMRGGSGTLEFESVGLKGTRSWFETHAVPLRDAQDEIVGLLGITRNITERKQAEESLRQSEELYRAVIEQATENIFLVDVESRRIVESNPAFREALGYTEEELRSMTIYDIVALGRESIDTNTRRIIQRGRYYIGERKYRRKDGSLVDVEVSASMVLHHGREVACIVAHDVTGRVQVQRLLEGYVAGLSRIASDVTLDLPMEDMLNALSESAVKASTAVACVVVLIDEGPETLHLFGSHGLPEGYTDGLQAAYRSGVRSPALKAFRTRQPMLIGDIRRFLLADPLYGPIHHFVREVPWDLTYNVPLVYRDRGLGVIFFCFLPGQEPGENERSFLKAVADQTAVAVENARLFSEARGKAALEERQRLARELHDSVSQALYGIALGSKTAREELDDDPDKLPELLDYVLSLAEAGMAEMRALIFELRPESLETEGVVAALQKQAAALEARYGIEVETDLCDEPEAPLETKEVIYRIVQEALNNTVKHARASRVRIKMWCDPEQISLEISDDGIGFDPGKDFPGHLGLRSMRERALWIGGALEVEAAKGRGTGIRTRIPI